MDVSIDLIRPSPYQPRITFDVEDLKQEVAKGGLLSELVVRKRDAYFELVDGERRLRVLKELGWKTAPVQVIDIDDREARRRVFRLNRHRKNYSTEEEARFFKKLADEGMTPGQIAEELGIDNDRVQANLDIFKFPDDIQQSIWSGSLSPSHIEVLHPVITTNFDRAIAIAREAVGKLSVNDLRRLLKPEIEAMQQARIQAAQKILGVIAPTPLPLETPEALEQASRALKEVARQKKVEKLGQLTPEERQALEAEQERKREKGLEFQKKHEEKIRQQALQEALQDAEFLKIAIGKAETILPADEVRKANAHPTALSDKHLAEMFKAPRQTWADLIRASEKRAWTPVELAAVVDTINDNKTPDRYKAQLLQGEADPIVTKGGEPAILEDTLKRRMTEALEQDKVVSLTRVWDALSKLELFDCKEVVDALDNFYLERVAKDTQRDIEYLNRLLSLACERLEFWREVDK